MLETIRKQERSLQLQRQLLDTMVPLVRRDCNYYNLDKVRAECKFDEEQGEWILPEVTTSSTSLSIIPSSGGGGTTHTPSHTRLVKRNPQAGRPISPNGLQDGEDDRYASKWQSKGNDMDYFTPKRAQELLAECSNLKGTPPLTDRGGRTIKPSASLGVMKSPSHHDQTSNGVFSSESLLHLQADGISKPRKLDAIPNFPGSYDYTTYMCSWLTFLYNSIYFKCTVSF